MITTDGANDFHLSRIAGQFVTIFDMSKNAMDARQIYGPFLLIRSQYVTNKGHICLPIGLDEQSGQKKARGTLAGGCVLVNRYIYMLSESCVIFLLTKF